MGKNFKLMLALIIAIFTLPVLGSTVFAADGTQDGETELNYIMLKDNENGDSSAARSFVKPAKLIVENGIKTVQIGFVGSSMIEELSIQNIESNIARNIDNNTGTISFQVDGELPEVLYMDMTINAGSFGVMNHTVRVFLNAESMSDVSSDLLQSTLIKKDLNYVMLKDNENKDSSAARFFVKPAKIWYENGSAKIDMNFTGSSMIEELSVQGMQSELTRNEDGETGTLTLTVPKELPEVLYVDMVINTGAPAPYGIMEHTVRLFLNKDSMSAISNELLESSIIKEEQPAEEPTEEPKQEPVKDSNEEKDAKYEINYVVKHATEDKASSADSFFTKPALLITKDGVNYLQLTITGWDMIDYLRTADGDVKVLKVNADGSALVQFKVNGNLASPINLDMHITVPGMYSMQHNARLFLDLDTKTEVKDTTTTPVSNKDKTTNNNNNNATKTDNKKATNNKTSTKQEVESNQLKPDKAYTMNYIVKHATQDQESAANQFFKKPAVLLTKNGVNYLQLTITNWSMVDSLSTAYGEVAVVKVNSDGSAVVQLRVNGDLADPIKLDMHITVPGMYSMQHSARLFLDVDSKTEISTGSHEIAAASNGNGVVVNPQTGENTNILLYVLLLIGSGIPLAMLVKRRFA
ncbi:NEAT domain-containing protein [Paucisalibacillus globulus]|uniref:NEAT domain-containing protein n=1 Tax=Paucisalibacillus globulus TaxID=351095 RepID=UPI0003FAAD78|nr:NEAT domain-containing protein [Paucisalibacillus globulus]